MYITIPALKHMKEGDCIINTTSVTAYSGSPRFLDYSATNGAILSFTRTYIYEKYYDMYPEILDEIFLVERNSELKVNMKKATGRYPSYPESARPR